MKIQNKFGDFLEELKDQIVSINDLIGDASTRKYFKIQLRNRSLILCEDNLGFKNGDNRFLDTQKILNKNGLNVPNIVKASMTEGLVLQEDVGDLSLNLYSKNENKYDLYFKVVEEIAKIQKITERNYFEKLEEEKKFSELIVNRELNIFIDQFSKVKSINKKNILEESILIKKEFFKSNFLPCHRDLHSLNIHLVGEKIYLIDFQDLRLGPLVYDLVSLLEDPYIEIPKNIKTQLKNHFFKVSNWPGSKNEFDMRYGQIAIQRLLKAIGTYFLQLNEKNNERYLIFVKPAISRINDLGLNDQYPHIYEALLTYSLEVS